MGKIDKIAQRERRRKRIRAKVVGTTERPRLSVFRSGIHIYAQLIDDSRHLTLVSVNDSEVKEDKKIKQSKDSKKTEASEKNTDIPESHNKGLKTNKAYKVGELLASKAIKKKIKKAVFDRGGYKYHGRVAALADGARKGGLEF